MRLITSCADNDLISTSFQVETKCGLLHLALICAGLAARAKGERERRE